MFCCVTPDLIKALGAHSGLCMFTACYSQVKNSHRMRDVKTSVHGQSIDGCKSQTLARSPIKNLRGPRCHSRNLRDCGDLKPQGKIFFSLLLFFPSKERFRDKGFPDSGFWPRCPAGPVCQSLAVRTSPALLPATDNSTGSVL